MKVCIDNFAMPFHLAHGGAATQIHGTLSGLRAAGVDAEFARWWDGSQKYDLLHCFGVPGLEYLGFAMGKGIPVVCTNLFTAACNRSLARMSFQGLVWRFYDAASKLPGGKVFFNQTTAEALRRCDACVVGLEAERQVLLRTFGVDDRKIHIVPLALEEAFFHPPAISDKNDWLVTTGTITPRKRSLELARLAHKANVPIRFVGKPYDESSQYWHDFQQLVDGIRVSHIPHTENVEDLKSLLASSRGFVLYSDYENWCLSAHEAAACGLPLLLPKQPWSVERFGDMARYFDIRDTARHANDLADFHAKAGDLGSPRIIQHTWAEIGARLAGVYAAIGLK